MESTQIKAAVKEQYGKVAKGEATCGSLCGCTDNAEGLAITFGYSAAELATLPEGANLGLSCGNPQAVAAMQPGETVLDLGSGAGFDCFLAARKVGPAGRVIGVDMTDAMLEKARANAEKSGLGNVEFRKGEIEALPVDDNSVDVTISNCVLNLVPDKDRAFREIHRVLEARRAAGGLGHGVGSRARGVASARTWKRWSAASAGRWCSMTTCRG